jgi:hypothetical protein
MANNIKEIFEEAKKHVEDSKLVFIQDIVDMLPISKDTFYRYFPTGSDEYDELKRMLSNNRINLKVSLRNKWYKSQSPALQMGLMKLLATDEELRKLSMEHREHSGEQQQVVINLGEGVKPED